MALGLRVQAKGPIFYGNRTPDFSICAMKANLPYLWDRQGGKCCPHWKSHTVGILLVQHERELKNHEIM